MLHSFDIFDTLVSRDIARPADLFTLLARRIRVAFGESMPPAFILDFPAIRLRAEGRAHRVAAAPEVTLDEIYEAIGRRPDAPPADQLERIKAMELECEIEHCYGISASIEAVRALRDRNERVVLISDMYLPAPTVRAMLAKCAPDLEDLPLYLSSEIGHRKVDGTLFAHVCREEKIRPHELRHRGDNYFPDFVMARKAGCEAVHYTDSTLNELENRIASPDNGPTGAIMAGAARKARLTKAKGRSAFQLGANFTGPLFYPFVDQAIEEAERRGIRRLCFLARDGRLLHRIAEARLARRHAAVELRYLYVSRQSTYLAGVDQIVPEQIEWAFAEDASTLTVELVAKRLGLAPEQLAGPAVAAAAGQPLDPDATERLRKRVLDDPQLRENILKKAAEARTRLLGYLSEEGIEAATEDPIGLVDVGWQGSIQDCLYRIFAAENPDVRFVGFYFGCLRFNGAATTANAKSAFQMLPSSRPGLAPVIELLMAADHGTTLGYRENQAGQWEPELKPLSPKSRAWDVAAYLEGIRAFAEELEACRARYPGFDWRARGVVNLLLELLEDSPGPVVRIAGDLPYDTGLEEKHPRPIAPAFGIGRALAFLFAGPRKRGEMTQWPGGSFARSSFPVRCLLALDPRRCLAFALRDLRPAESTRFKLLRLRHRIRFALHDRLKLR